MSNVKTIEIEGTMPSDAGGDDDLLRMLGMISLPSMGINITYSNGTAVVPNGRGGRVTMHRFRLHGQEAMAYSFIDLFIDRVKHVGGDIRINNVIDIEA